MDKMTKKIVRAFILMVIAAALVLVGFYMLTNRKISTTEKTVTQSSSEIEKLKAKDLELSYPGTPSEVVKLYWRLNKCMYNTSMSDKDFEALLQQLRLLYDEELLATEGNSWENMLENFKKDKKNFSNAKRVISSYTVEGDKSVKYATLEGKECATVFSDTLETVKSKNTMTHAKFMCRKDDNGKWKILGWEKTAANEADESEE